MDFIKEAFQKIKNDVEILRFSLEELAKEMIFLHEEFEKIRKDSENIQLSNPTDVGLISTNQRIFPTNPTQTQHINSLYRPLKDKNTLFSIGNEGVPTDRQTDQQTDRHIKNGSFLQKNKEKTINDSLEILHSLDNIKKEIRIKFKSLTEQEMLVFSTVYQLEEEFGFSDYKSISQKLNLTESSIRDYVGRLIKKGIPVDKNKINNKTIHLNISKNLKSMASLQTILSLREI